MPAPTRINTAELKLAVGKAHKKVDEAFAILAPYLVLLSDSERASMPRAREGFDQAGRSLCRAMVEHPNIAKAAAFDAEAVEEDLDNVNVILPLFERVDELWQRLADTKLTWTAEAWTPSLIAYGVAKALSEVNAALRTVTSPLGKIFATRRARATEEQQPAAPAAPATAEPEKAKEPAKPAP